MPSKEISIIIPWENVNSLTPKNSHMGYSDAKRRQGVNVKRRRGDKEDRGKIKEIGI